MDAHLARNGEQVKHGVGRSAAGCDAGDGVLERFARDDLRWAAIGADSIHQHAAGFARGCVLVFRGGGNAGKMHRRDAENFAAHGHGVGGELAAACAGAGTGIGFESFKAGIVDLAGGVRADAFEDILNRNVDLPWGPSAFQERSIRRRASCREYRGGRAP